MARSNVARTSLVALSAAAVLLGCAACTTGTNAADDGADAPNDTIRTSFFADPSSFSPLTQRSIDDANAGRLLFDTLVRRDTGGVTAGLATDWDVTADGGTFTIRKDATCSDGTPLTATAVAESLKAFSDPKTGSPYSRQVFGQQPSSITGDDAAGTVTITLAAPFADMLMQLSHPASGIICAPGLADPEGLQAGNVDGAGTGPYVLSKSVRGSEYTFDLRDDYDAWPTYAEPLKGEPAAHIIFNVSSNQTTVANQLLTGGQDFANFNGKEGQRFEGKDGFTTQSYPNSSFYLMFNQRATSPFASAELRKAVAVLVDRKGFNNAVTGGLGKPQTSLALPGVQCANTDDSVLITGDAGEAADLLKGKSIRILGSQAFGPNGAAGEYVAQVLRTAGADVELSNVDNSTWVTQGTQQPDSWDITFMAASTWTTMHSYLASVSGPSTEQGGLNWTGAPHDDVVALDAAASAEIDETARCALASEAETTLIRNADAVPLATASGQVVTRDGVSVSIFDGFIDYHTLRVG